MQLFAMQSVKSLTGENSCRNLPVSYCKLRRYKNAEVREMKSKVAIVRAKPETVLDNIYRACELAEMNRALDKSATTILKDNISWHLPMPGANTTPWGLEGIYLALKKMGYDDIVVVENRTVVTIAEKGDKYCKFEPVFKKYNIPVKFNFKPEDMKWIRYEPKGKMLVLDKIFRKRGIYIPDYFIGKNIVHLPTVKTHSYTVTTGAMKTPSGDCSTTSAMPPTHTSTRLWLTF